MDCWTYKDPSGFFDLNLPADWSSYDDEQTVHAFFDTTRWTGNLRITHYYRQDGGDSQPDVDEQFIADQVNNHEGAVRIALGPLLSAHYAGPAKYEEDEEPLAMYYWMAAAGRHRFACSLAAPQEKALSLDRSKTLQLVEDIIASIVLYR